MPVNKKKQFFEKALELYAKNLNQKDIALQLGLTPKTVSEWLKEVKNREVTNKENLKELEMKLKQLLADSTSKTEDIKNITIAIEKLENRWFTKLNK